MAKTMIEKIIEAHCKRSVKPGDVVDMGIDVRLARDFGGANVVKNLASNNLEINDPKRTFFTFDCNPTGSDQKYAANQQFCRTFARRQNIRIYDIDKGIGTHLAIDEGLIAPGETLVSTDSHANIMGAIGTFGQGMGDIDIAHAFAFGRVWFRTPPTIKIILCGKPGENATAKDITLAILKKFGAGGLLGYTGELFGTIVDSLNLDSRITISSMATEMAGIILFIPPNEEIIGYCEKAVGKNISGVYPDPDAEYVKVVEVDIDGLEPLISQPGHPDDVVSVEEVKETKIDSCFIGSCTNGRFEDMEATARILKGRKVAPGVVLKIVPSTYRVWKQCLDKGLIKTFVEAGALVGNPGCAGCAAGQIGQNGPGEVTVSTGNRNFPGKQGQGDVYLASPDTVAASSIAGVITSSDRIPSEPVTFKVEPVAERREEKLFKKEKGKKPVEVEGRAWVITMDNIDTDMIYHNRYLSITDIKQMGQYTFDNLKGYEDFAKKAKPGDIVVTGKNFGCGSSRQQAVDCFRSLGISTIIAESFGSIYERNAINSAMPIMIAENFLTKLKYGDIIRVNFQSGEIKIITRNETLKAQPFSDVQMDIYQRGSLLKKEI